MNIRKINIVVLGLCLVWFFFACGYCLSGAGLHEGECYVGTGCLRTIRLIVSGDFLSIPLMESFYVGTFLHIISIPFTLLVSDKTLALRLSALIYSAGFLVCMFLVLRRWFGDGVAGLTLVLTAFNSSFIRSVRFGTEREEMLQIFFVWLGFLLISQARKTGKNIWAVAAAALWGLALWAKLMFAGYMVGFCLGGLVYPRSLLLFVRQKLGIDSLKKAGLLAGAFFVGALPLVVYMSANFVYVLRMVFSSIGPTGTGWNNVQIYENVKMRFLDVTKLLSSTLYWIDDIFYPQANNIFPVLAVMSLVFVVGLIVLRRAWFSRETVGFLLLTYLGLLLSSCYVPFGHAIEHVVILIPVFELMTALFCVSILRCVFFKKTAAVFLAFVLGLSVVQETAIVRHCLLKTSGGELRVDSSPVYEAMADAALSRGPLPVVAPVLIRYRLGYYSGLKIKPLCYFNNWHPEEIDLREPEEFYKQELAGLNRYMLFTLSWGDEDEYGQKLIEVIGAHGRQVVPVGKWSGGDRTEEFIELFEVIPADAG